MTILTCPQVEEQQPIKNIDCSSLKNYALEDVHKAFLQKLGENNRLVTVFVKWNYGALTDLQNFQKPEDVALIGYFSHHVAHTFDENWLSKFDVIIWYEAVNNEFDWLPPEIMTEGGFIPGLDEFLGQLVKVVPKEKCKLIEGEEDLVARMCHLRKTHGIPGPHFDELENVRNKAVQKLTCEKEGVPTAKFALVDFKKVSNVNEVLSTVMERIGSFPMFRKPVYGSGSFDCVKVHNIEQLKAWIEKAISEKNDQVYLVEEFVTGIEINVALCLLPNGTWRPLHLSHNGETTICKAIEEGVPIPFHGDRFEDFEKEFPGIYEYSEKVVKAFKPPHPHLFNFQAFQLEPNSDKYYLIELSYRMQGQRDTKLSYQACGVNQETALLQCHLDPNYTADPDPNRPNYFQRDLWYLYSEGILKSHKGVPKDAPISSEIIYNWFIQPGTRMCKPNWVSNMACVVTLRNADKKQLLEDVEWVQKNWNIEYEPMKIGECKE